MPNRCSNAIVNFTMYKYFLLCYLVCLVYASTIHQAYGPFKVVLLSAEGCKGPKRKNCTDIELKKNGSKLTYYVHIKENTAPTKGKIVGINNGKQGLTFQIKSLCSHVFLRSLLEKVFNVTRDCVVLKGYYNFTIDMQELMEIYHGDTFVYGDWSFKSVFFNNNCNFHCLNATYKVFPKEKEIKKRQ